MPLLKLFQEHWAAKRFTSPRDIVLLAVSGGCDSKVMADLFLKSNIPFAVAHCNFALRGTAADLDEQLVHDWCKKNAIAFFSTRFATKEKAEEWKKGIQETARILRYEWFEKIREANGFARIATAHHADDNVETLLINLFKGTGISGLHGILPENGRVIRPLLFAPKQMVEAYAAVNGVDFREDASNASDDYLRNAVRHNIIPVVNQWFPNAIDHVNGSIERFAEAEILYRRSIDQERKKLLEQRGHDYYIPVLKLRQREPLATICYELLQPFGFTSLQIPHVLHLLESETGHYVSSASHRVIRNRNFLVITAHAAATADFIQVEGAPCTIDTGKYHFTFNIHNRPKVIDRDRNTACLDLKDIEFPIILRKWRIGDYFYPFGMNMKKKKVSRILIDEKVPVHEKEDIRILECNKRIAWVSGIRPDERFKVKESSDQVLVVKRIPK